VIIYTVTSQHRKYSRPSIRRLYGRSSKEPRSALSLPLVDATCQSTFTAAPAQGVGLARTCVAVVQRDH